MGAKILCLGALTCGDASGYEIKKIFEGAPFAHFHQVSFGVFIGLLVTGQPFGIVMSGIGVIALAGIVVNNNIVLIDTYGRLKETASSAREAILRTGGQRLRPVLLTTVTTMLGAVV